MRIRRAINVLSHCNKEIKRIFRFARCRRGITAVEFAIIAPIVLLMIMGFVEFGIILFLQNVLETANTIGPRFEAAEAQNVSRASYIRSEVQRLSAGLMDPTRLNISANYFDAFPDNSGEPCINPPTAPCPGTPGVNFTDINGNRMWDSNMSAVGEGGMGALVVYTVTYPWQVFTPILWPVLGDGRGNYLITATSATRNAVN